MSKEVDNKSRYVGLGAVKSAKRVQFIDGVVKVLTTPKLYKGLSPNIDEHKFIFNLKSDLERGVEKLFAAENPTKDSEWIQNKADNALIWEHDTTVTLNQTRFFGTQHRPDMFIRHGNDYRIAIEYKVVSSGTPIREALGQCLVYASEYEFSICVLFDKTKDQKIFHAYKNGMLESVLIKKLWDDFGARVVVVAPNM